MTEDMRSIIDDERDLELVVNYLNGHLEPDRIEAVRKRLDEDEAFRDLAAPLLLTWSIPTKIERDPRPEGEWEREWAELTARPEFAEARAAHAAYAARQTGAREEKPSWRTVGERTWRWWTGWRGWWSSQGLRVFLLLALGAASIYLTFTGDPLAQPSPDDPGFRSVAYTSGWIAIGDGMEAQLTRGASLRVGERLVDGERVVRLDGVARFRVPPLDSGGFARPTQALRVHTRAGMLIAGASEFTVRTNGDTTVVLVHAGEQQTFGISPVRVNAITETDDHTQSGMFLRDGDGARLVRGQDPERLSKDAWAKLGGPF